MKLLSSLAVIALIVLLAIAASTAAEHSAKNWAAGHGYTVQKYEQHAVILGPFVYIKGATVSRMEVLDKAGTAHVLWFRSYFVEQCYEELSDGKYRML